MADAPKMKSGTFSLRNTAPGVRGFHDFESGYVDVEPGATVSGVRFTEAEYASATATGAFEIVAGNEAPEAPATDDTPGGAKALRDITVADLKAHLDAQTPPVAYESDANKQALYDLYAATFQPAEQPPVTPAPTDELDKASDDDLRDIVTALVGADKVPEGADRETLLALARGE